MATSFEESNLQNLLEKIAGDEGFQNPKFDITCATNPGDNFIGQVFRVKVEDSIQKNSLSLIFKVSSPNIKRKEKFKSDDLFRIESEMYETILPTLNNLLKKRGLSNGPVFPGTPRCYATAVNRSADERDVIVLEDKKVDGFTMTSIRNGLDVAQCRLALQKVALLHSSFMALRELEPETADRLSKIVERMVWNKDDLVIIDFRQGYLDGLALLGEPYTAGNPVYQKLYKIYEEFNEVFAKLCEIPEDIVCINHGDFWANNILFKLNQDDVAEDACLIDFQLASLQSPINDITAFVFTSTTKEVRDQHYDELIQFYYDELTRTLLDCGCNPESVIPWTKFLKHVQFYSKLGIMSAIGSLPVLMADQSEVQTDIHATNTDVALFTGTTRITNTETIERLMKRLNGVVEDAEELGYI